MKAALYIEAIGWAANRQAQLRAQPRPWVAEILGPDSIMGYDRCFLRPRVDHTHANRTGARGVHYLWLLDPGAVYEVEQSVSWSRRVRRLVTVTEQGEIVDVSPEEVAARWESGTSGSTS